MPIVLNKPLTLGSASPRREQILTESGIPFTVKVPDVEESYPDHFQPQAVPIHLAEKKALAFKDSLADQLILTADTIVSLDGKILGKPDHEDDAKEYLFKLSGRSHTVTTGVCLMAEGMQESFYEETTVAFRHLLEDEVDYYVAQYRPLDKAGAYGIQEWIGLMGIQAIHGSYPNVMGLPIGAVYQRLQKLAGLTLSQA